jgi:hypothetical protein
MGVACTEDRVQDQDGGNYWGVRWSEYEVEAEADAIDVVSYSAVKILNWTGFRHSLLPLREKEYLLVSLSSAQV